MVLPNFAQLRLKYAGNNLSTECVDHAERGVLRMIRAY